jgi:hypothetical protein
MEVDKNDGSGTITETAGTGSCVGAGWVSGLPCGDDGVNETVGAPSGGSVAVTLNTTIAGTVQSSTLDIPVATLYPNGVPTATSSAMQSVGAPLSAPPAPCAVTAAYQGPVVPVTSVTSFWYPTAMELYTATEVDYLAPAIGPICVVRHQHVDTVFFGLDGTSTLAPPSDVFNRDFIATDSLTGVGPQLQSGTIVTMGRTRAPAALRPAALFRPWAPLPPSLQRKNAR